MSSFITNLTTAAQANVSDSGTVSDSLPEHLKEAIAFAQEENKEAAKKALGSALTQVLSHLDAYKERQRASIKTQRRRIDECKKSMSHADLLFAYGSETGNFIPLADFVGCDTYDAPNDLRYMPEDWKPSASE